MWKKNYNADRVADKSEDCPARMRSKNQLNFYSCFWFSLHVFVFTILTKSKGKEDGTGRGGTGRDGTGAPWISVEEQEWPTSTQVHLACLWIPCESLEIGIEKWYLWFIFTLIFCSYYVFENFRNWYILELFSRLFGGWKNFDVKMKINSPGFSRVQEIAEGCTRCIYKMEKTSWFLN